MSDSTRRGAVHHVDPAFAAWLIEGERRQRERAVEQALAMQRTLIDEALRARAVLREERERELSLMAAEIDPEDPGTILIDLPPAIHAWLRLPPLRRPRPPV